MDDVYFVGLRARDTRFDADFSLKVTGGGAATLQTGAGLGDGEYRA